MGRLGSLAFAARQVRQAGGFVACLVLLATCTADEHANSSYGCEHCPSGNCYKGYCLAGLTAESNPGPITAMPVPGDPCGEERQKSDCYTGPEGTLGKGVCEKGSALCSGAVWGPCEGQVVPSKREVCNGQDDDCDGDVDEDPRLGACPPPESGACAGREVCVNGELGCEAILEAGEEICNGADDDCDGLIDEAAKAETCNGVDDDCDGAIDEDADQPCYSDALGCTQTPETGDFACLGLCKAGTQRCIDGKLSRVCQGQVTPGRELCDGDRVAADEDCNGLANDGCACVENQSQECYDGRQGTQGVGPCRGGSHVCVDGHFGSCAGEVLPELETCLNIGIDNDCNGQLDDIVFPGMLGGPCVEPRAQGVCREGTFQCRGSSLPTCVTPPPGTEVCDGMTDEDCDGHVDEDFVLDTDSENCGRCGMRCVGTSCVDRSCGGAGGMGGGGAGGAGAGGAGGEAAP